MEVLLHSILAAKFSNIFSMVETSKWMPMAVDGHSSTAGFIINIPKRTDFLFGAQSYFYILLEPQSHVIYVMEPHF